MTVRSVHLHGDRAAVRAGAVEAVLTLTREMIGHKG